MQPAAPPDAELEDEDTPVAGNVDEAITWYHLVERFGKIELGFSAFQQSFPRFEALVNEVLIPWLNKLMVQVDGLSQRQERSGQRLETFFDEQWPKLVEAVDLLGERLERVERKQDDFVREIALHNDRIARAEKRLDDFERQLDVINLERRDRSVVAAERKRWWSRIVNLPNAIAAGVGAVVVAVGHWESIVDLFTR